MKKERILIYKDEKYESKVLSEAPKVREALQDLVNQFNGLGLGDVQPNELDNLCRDPKGLYQSRVDRKIEIPAGLNKAKYLEMVDLPNFAGVQAAHERIFRFTDFDLNSFSLQDGKVIVDMAVVNQLAQSQHVFIESGSKEHELYKDLITLMDQLNKFDDIIPDGCVDARVQNPLRRLFGVKEIGVGIRHKYVFNIENFRRILASRKVRSAPALS